MSCTVKAAQAPCPSASPYSPLSSSEADEEDDERSDPLSVRCQLRMLLGPISAWELGVRICSSASLPSCGSGCVYVYTWVEGSADGRQIRQGR